MLGFGLGLNKWRRVGGGFVGLLDLYPNAAAAYSLRKLRAAYSGAAVRVRRSSDNTEQDIAFDANGDLNTSSLLSFVNEDYNQYTSDWSGDVDGWTVNNAGGGTVILSNDTNRLKIDVSGLTTTGFRPALNFPTTIWPNITEGCSVTIKIEGSNLVVDGMFVNGTFQNITDHDLDTGAFTYTFTKAASNTSVIYFNSTGKGNYVGFLESVVITQTTADGQATVSYDQAASINASQTTATNQPTIVSAGTIVDINGKPANDFDSSDFLLLSQPFEGGVIAAKSDLTFLIVGEFGSGANRDFLSCVGSASDAIIVRQTSTQTASVTLGGVTVTSTFTLSGLDGLLVYVDYAGAEITLTKISDGTTEVFSSITWSGDWGTTSGLTGGVCGISVNSSSGTGNSIDGKLGELVVWDSNLVSSNASIRSNVKDFWGI